MFDKYQNNEPKDIFEGVNTDVSKVSENVSAPNSNNFVYETESNKNWIYILILVFFITASVLMGWYFREDIKGWFVKSNNIPEKVEVKNNLKSSELFDSDNDGLKDDIEKNLGTDPLKKDTDGDGIEDSMEVNYFKTDPKKNDSDNDGYNDGDEIRGGFNPNGPGKL